MLDNKIQKIVDKFNTIDELNNEIVEREELINLCKIAIVSKKNLFILGKPGLSKTLIVDNIVSKIDNIKYFKTLMTKEKSSTQLFGKMDLKSLINGEPRVATKNKIPEANINFIDEIFKGNDICLNSLLQLLNFEKLDIEGTEGVKAPTLCTFSASNEIPDFDDDDNAILRPLYDRLHLKYVAEPIQNKENYFKAVRTKRNKKQEKVNNILTLDDIEKLNDACKNVIVSDECDEIIWNIAQDISTKLSIYVSDRKLIEYSTIVQAAALLDGRDEVIPSKDFKVLKYYLWDKENQIKEIEQIINKNTIDEFVQLLVSIKESLVKCKEEFTETVDNLIEANNGLENCKKAERYKIVKDIEEQLSQTLAALYQARENKNGEISNEGEKLFDNIENDIEKIADNVANKLDLPYRSIKNLASANRLI